MRSRSIARLRRLRSCLDDHAPACLEGDELPQTQPPEVAAFAPTTPKLHGTPVANSVGVEDPSTSKSPGAEARSRRSVPPAEVPWARLGNLILGLWLQI